MATPAPQLLLQLDTDRRVPMFKCLVCDFETPDRAVEAKHAMRCGAMVLVEHHAMAKTAYLAGLAELERRKAERGSKGSKAGHQKLGWWDVAAKGAGRVMASESLAATDSHSAALGPPRHEAGAGQASGPGDLRRPLADQAAAPVIP